MITFTPIILYPGDKVPDPLIGVAIRGHAGLIRQTEQGGSHPTDIGLTEVQLGAETRHVVIHDVHDVNLWSVSANVKRDVLIYDLTVGRVGWWCSDPTDRPEEFGGHGQAFYSQKYASSGWVDIDTSVFIAGFSWMKIYGSNSEINGVAESGYLEGKNKLANYRIKRTAFVGKAFLIGSEGQWGAHNIHFDDCAFLDSQLRMGYQGINGDGSIIDSLLTGGLSIEAARAPALSLPSWRNLTVTGNDIVLPAGAIVNVVMPGRGAWVWNHHTYYMDDPTAKQFFVRDYFGQAVTSRRSMTFDEWQEHTGFDTNSHIKPIRERYRRIYSIPERGEQNVVAWSKTPLNLPDDAMGQVYPHPLPLNWHGGAPVEDSDHVEIRRVLMTEEEEMPEDVRELVEKLTALDMSVEQALALLDLVAALNPDRDWESFRARSALLAERDLKQKAVREAEELLRSRQSALRTIDSQLEQSRRQMP